MKHKFVYLLFSYLLFSCDSKVTEYNLSCNDIGLEVVFESKNFGLDLTGENLNPPYVKYYKDSIRYQIISGFDTSEVFFPEIKNIRGYNFYNLNVNFNKKYIRHDLIIHLSSSYRLNLNVRVSDFKFTDPKIYQNDSLLISGFDNCFAKLYLKL